jgi:hypothetical protein
MAENSCDCCRNFVPPGYPPTPTVVLVTQPDCFGNRNNCVSDSASLYSYDNGNTWVTKFNEWFEITAGYDVAIIKMLGLCFACCYISAEIKAFINTEPLPVINESTALL